MLLLLDRDQPVGNVFSALTRGFLSLFELRRLFRLAFLFFLSLLKFVIRLFCHVVLRSGNVERIAS